MPTRPLRLGRGRPALGGDAVDLELPAHHLVTHAVVLGMTGSGKTGLALVLVEEALRSRIPVLMIDIKGDLPNLLLSFPGLRGDEFAPWVDEAAAARDGKTAAEVGEALAQRWREGLAGAGLAAADVAAFRAGIAPRVLTPGTTAGEPVNVLSSLDTRSPLWDEDEEAAREALGASISLLLRLTGRPGDLRDRDHVVLSHLAERRLRAGNQAGLAELLGDLAEPPVAQIGAMSFDDFLSPKERQTIAQDLNTLLASPTFASWRQGAALDVGAWLRPVDGRTPAVIVSVAHLDDDERALVLGLLLEQILSWVRGLPGTTELRALVLFDEVYGFLPPHPANPPTKRPLLSLLKQARAFGVGVALATQNPMDLDYKALSNAGVWFVGRLTTDADRARVVEALADSTGAGLDPAALGATLKALPGRTFFVRDVHQTQSSMLLETRWAMSWLRGPMTRREIARLRPAMRSADAAAAIAPETLPAPVVAPAAPGTGSGSEGDEEGVVATAPMAPEGWSVRYGHAPDLPASQWFYTPHALATVVAHLRDAKLGVSRSRTVHLVAPFGADGRPDLTRVSEVDPAHLAATPPHGARYQSLPAPLAKKSIAQAAERALREHATRTLSLRVDVHAELGLSRADSEAPQAFVARCVEESRRRAAVARNDVIHRQAARLAKLSERVRSAHAELRHADSSVAAAPGEVSAALLGMFAGARSGRRAMGQRDKAATKLERARGAVVDAELALREATTARDAEIVSLLEAAERAAEGIVSRDLVPRKGDVEVTAIALAWSGF